MTSDAAEEVIVQIGVFSLSIITLVVIVWAISIFVRARTQREAHRLELHTRLLDRIGSTREFGEFLSSENGQRFLEAITPPTARPQWRLLWALFGGIVLALGGGAAFLAGEDSGWLAMAVGLSLIVAFAVSWRLARAFGLIDSDAARRPPAAPSA